MDEYVTNEQDAVPVMSAREAWLRYCACMALLAVALAGLYRDWFGFDPVMLVYIGSGVYLNRTVLRRLVVFHEVYNTLGNVASEKIRFFLFWPFKYLAMLVQFGVDDLL